MRLFKKILICLLAILPISAAANAETVVLTEKNHTAITGTVDDDSVSKVIKFLNMSTEENVYLYLDSPGGSVFAGLRLVEALRSTTKTVTCVVQEAASMAFVITQACHKRLITENGLMMQHVASYGLRGQEPNNFSFAQFINRVSKKMDEDQAKRIGLSYDDFRQKVRDDWWLFGKEAKTANVADDTTTVSCDSELARTIKKKKVQVFIFSVTVAYSACPLVSGEIELQTKQGDEILVDTPKEVTQAMQKQKPTRENGFIWDRLD